VLAIKLRKMRVKGMPVTNPDLGIGLGLMADMVDLVNRKGRRPRNISPHGPH
jgi:hypothetical protein